MRKQGVGRSRPATAALPVLLSLVLDARNTQRVSCVVIPGKAAGRDPESTPLPLDSGLRRNDGLLRVSAARKSPRQNPPRNYGARYLALALLVCCASAGAVQAQVTCLGKPATLVGTEGHDTLTGTAGDDVIVGLGGKDNIKGLNGNDLICAGGGNDVVESGLGNDTVEGGPGDDLLKGLGGNDRLEGGLGIDQLEGGAGTDVCVNGEKHTGCETSFVDVDVDGFSVQAGDCNDQDPTIHPGAVESCNSIDNDCDGAVDDGFDVGTACTAGVGACVRSGAKVCTADGSGTVCDAAPGTPTAEVCNNLDDNCDGTIDDGFTLGSACTAGVGSCAREGVTVCAVDGNGTACNGIPGSPTAEACNNLDDDCNGTIDDGLGTLTCGVGACARTVSSCTNGQPGECVPGNPTAEVCENGIDEDCNGSDLICVVTLDIAITGPANLSSTNQPTIAVTGTVDPTATEVTCNGRPAGINASGFGGNVPLKEGSNIVTCVATDASGNVGSASITVSLDSTPPRVTIDSPEDGAVLVASPVTVTGIVNDLVMGTVNGDEAGVTCNGVQAQVANRRFVVADLPLTAGANTITCIGEDKVGNVDTAHIAVTLDTTAPAKISIMSGNNQTAGIGTLLPQPLIVGLSENGAPAVGKVVVFKVLQNDGALSTNTNSGRILAVNTDTNGHAAVQFTLGSWAGAGNNQVEAMTTGFVGEARFSASALPAGPNNIVVDSGNNQTGATGQLLPKPFVAAVIDRGSNRLGGVPVTFRVLQGEGNFNGQPEVTLPTDSDGRVAATLTLGATVGFDNNLVQATFPNNPGQAVSFVASGKAVGDPAQTKISGVVLDNSNLPIAGVTLHVEGTSLTTQSDAQGQFVLQPAPVGKVLLVADGATAQRPGTWPKLEYELVTVAGQDNTIGMPVYLLPLDLANGLLVDETNGGTLTLPDVPGFSLTIAPGAATFPDGTRRGLVSVTVVHADKVPMVPNFGQQPRFIITIQPAGTHFNPPAAITMPNVDGFAPGQKTEMYSFDHDLGSFISIGPATVSDDGTVVKSDPGVGVVKGGWHCGGNPEGIGTCEHECDDGNDCTSDHRFAGGCLSLNNPDGTPCRDVDLQSFECFPGVNIQIDDSCRGVCKVTEPGGVSHWVDKTDRTGIGTLAIAAVDACEKIFDGCIGEPLRTPMHNNLKRNGFKITCVDRPDPNGDGFAACGSAPLGGNSLKISNLSAAGTDRCGPVEKTIRHEMQHGAGLDNHEYLADGKTLDCANDSVFACDVACYGFSNCPGARAELCK